MTIKNSDVKHMGNYWSEPKWSDLGGLRIKFDVPEFSSSDLDDVCTEHRIRLQNNFKQIEKLHTDICNDLATQQTAQGVVTGHMLNVKHLNKINDIIDGWEIELRLVDEHLRGVISLKPENYWIFCIRDTVHRDAIILGRQKLISVMRNAIRQMREIYTKDRKLVYPAKTPQAEP